MFDWINLRYWLSWATKQGIAAINHQFIEFASAGFYCFYSNTTQSKTRLSFGLHKTGFHSSILVCLRACKQSQAQLYLDLQQAISWIGPAYQSIQPVEMGQQPTWLGQEIGLVNPVWGGRVSHLKFSFWGLIFVRVCSTHSVFTTAVRLWILSTIDSFIQI